jgi:Cysteine-rich CWC
MSDAPARAATARCPRCGAAFHCGIDDEAPCACTGITLDAATLADLRRRGGGCLCLRCLQLLADEAPVAPVPCG